MKSREDSLNLLQKLITRKFLKNKNRYSSKEKRYTEFLKAPERTVSDIDDWFMFVPVCFNDCLDISKTERVVKTGRKIFDEKTQKNKDETETIKVWTQGSRFAFHRGCILYDTPQAYDNWCDAIKEIKCCISIHMGTSAEPAMNDKERYPGIVEFSVFSPTQNVSLEEIGRFTLTQDEFVSFLIKGNQEIISI